jgi:hypothetical protein
MLPILQRFRLARQTTPDTASIYGLALGQATSKYIATRLVRALGCGPPNAQRRVGCAQVSPELVFKIAPENRPAVTALLFCLRQK